VATTEAGSRPVAPEEPLLDSSASPSGGLAVSRRRLSSLVYRAQWSGGGSRPPRKIRWWFELLLGVLGYYLYALARTLNGDDPETKRAAARANGQALFDFEKAIGVDWEKGLQHNVLPYKGFMQVVGGFYGGAHFVITIGVLLFLLFRRPQFYRFWRTVLFVLTMTAVGIFALFPAMPPRLLLDSAGRPITVDSLDKIGGLWSYNHGVVERISDPFAPMPSLHLGWSTWVALALLFCIPASTWKRKLAVFLYPCAVYFTVIATGTHFVIDGVAGMALTTVVVFGSAWVVLAWRKRRSAGEPSELSGG
jgi:hypothetical protein